MRLFRAMDTSLEQKLIAVGNLAALLLQGDTCQYCCFHSEPKVKHAANDARLVMQSEIT